MSYTKAKMFDQSGIYILDELNPDAPSAEEVRLSNENRELRHELLGLRKDFMAAVEQIQELQASLITEE